MRVQVLRSLAAALAGAAVFVAAPAAVPADGPPQTPILRLELGMHSSKSRQVGTDTQGRFVITSSFDKTARLWDASNGQLHGFNDSNGDYYYLPVEADVEKLKRTGVPFSDIRSTVSHIAGKVLFFMDTCHSGNLMASRAAGAERDIVGVINDLASAEDGAIVFASSTGSQVSYEDPSWGNGAFTKALLEGLSGAAVYGSPQGLVTVKKLDLYLSDCVKELTGGKQTPTTTTPPNVPDFPIAIKG